MSYASKLLDTYPRTFNVDAGELAATIDALNHCAHACTADAHDDLSELNVAELVKSIPLCLDCGGGCATAARRGKCVLVKPHLLAWANRTTFDFRWGPGLVREGSTLTAPRKEPLCAGMDAFATLAGLARPLSQS